MDFSLILCGEKNFYRTAIVLEQFSLSQDKELQVTLYERGGGRTLSFSLDQEDLLLAQKIDQLKLKW